MAPRWQPGEEYTYGDVVEFEGRTSLSSIQHDLIAMIQGLITRSYNPTAPR